MLRRELFQCVDNTLTFCYTLTEVKDEHGATTGRHREWQKVPTNHGSRSIGRSSRQQNLALLPPHNFHRRHVAPHAFHVHRVFGDAIHLQTAADDGPIGVL